MQYLKSLLCLTFSVFVCNLFAATASFDPRQGTDAAGNALVVWGDVDTLTLASTVQAAYKPFAGSWGAPLVISNASAQASDPRMAMNAGGDAVAVWIETAPSNLSHLYAAIRPAAGPWTTPVLICNISDDVRKDFEVSINSTGVIYVTYSSFVTSQLYTNIGSVGGSWGTPQQISN
jgi:hypothetical protein